MSIKHHENILQQMRLLEEVNSLQAVALENAVIGNKYLFSMNETYCYYYIGELSELRVIQTGNKQWKQYHHIVFQNYTGIHQLLPNFSGKISPINNTFRANAYESKLVKLYTLNYTNYLESLK
jgi:hypothetical protein